MEGGKAFIILFIVSLLCSSLGFYTFLYFISVGYGLSIFGLGVTMLIIFHDELTLGLVLLNLMFMFYGARLSFYLLIRERKKAYQELLKTEVKKDSEIPFFVKLSVWITTSLLYYLMVSPVCWRLCNKDGSDLITYIGALIMLGGIILESAADWQKAKAKAVNPKRFVDTGLYSFVRCPNYLGEILCWTGVFVSSFSSLHGLTQWITAILGYISIVYIMFGGARRLEIRQIKNYGKDPQYIKYVKSTPIILPFVPLYSVARHKWLVG